MLQLVCEIFLALVFVFGLYLLKRKLIGKTEYFDKESEGEKRPDFEQKSDENH